MAVGLGDQDSAVLVSDPGSNRLEVDPLFNGVAHEKVPHGVVSEVGNARLSTPTGQSLLGAINGNHSA